MMHGKVRVTSIAVEDSHYHSGILAKVTAEGRLPEDHIYMVEILYPGRKAPRIGDVLDIWVRHGSEPYVEFKEVEVF